jgi:hypothetical protein
MFSGLSAHMIILPGTNLVQQLHLTIANFTKGALLP